MRGATRATLDELRSSDWFSRVGIQEAEHAIVLASWDEALASSQSLGWENLCQEAVNRYRGQIRRLNPQVLRHWNETVRLIKPHTMALVKQKLDEAHAHRSVPLEIEDAVQWDMLHACIEAELSEEVPPGFFASQAFWYVRGHFPCGWRGSFPEGSLIIF